jgi:hypothetical protein
VIQHNMRPRPGIRPEMRLADDCITLGVSTVFLGALIVAFGYPAPAAFMPKLIATFGLAVSMLMLAVCLFRQPRADVAEAGATGSPSDATTQPPGDDAGDNLEYAFSHASWVLWLTAIAWLSLFFGALFILGLYATSFLFPLLFLRYSGKTSWRFASVYAAILAVSLFSLLEVLLAIPVPPGMLST